MCNYDLFSRNKFSETLRVHWVNIVAMKTDISTAHNQVQLLSKSHNDVITTVNTRLKQKLAENVVLSQENISKLKARCSQLLEDKENSEAENKRLVNTIQQIELQHRQSEETNKSTFSELKGELNGIAKYILCA